MIALTPDELALAVDGRLHGQGLAYPVTGPVVIDSRQVTRGGLFVAMKGEHVDGHDYAAAAVRGGAALVLTEREIVDVPCVVVADTVAALGRLARYVLGRLPDVTVIGITGSSGKTSTKDLVGHVLAGRGSTIAPKGSYNNEIGLPLTVLSADAGTTHLVLEMGARSPGHIGHLCEIARPSIGAVLNVGLAHVGEFGSVAATARAKAELVNSLPPSGTAVLNADDPLVIGMRRATAARVLTYGVAAAHTDVRAVHVHLDERGRARFQLETPAGSEPVHLQVYGAHQVSNALAAAAIAVTVGVAPAATAHALSNATAASRWRMEVTDRADGVTVVNDAYNANPGSMRAALEALVAIAGAGRLGDDPPRPPAGAGSRGDDPPRPPAGASRRTWAVLGEMLELGERSVAEHEAIGRLARELGVARLVAVGEGARPIHAGAGGEAGGSVFVPDADAAVALLRAELRPPDVVLVKASRSIGLERVADALLGEPHAAQQGGPA